MFCTLDINACNHWQILTLISLVLFALHQSICQLNLVHVFVACPQTSKVEKKFKFRTNGPRVISLGVPFLAHFHPGEALMHILNASSGDSDVLVLATGDGNLEGQKANTVSRPWWNVAKRSLGTELDPGWMSIFYNVEIPKDLICSASSQQTIKTKEHIRITQRFLQPIDIYIYI